jgi:hypothetical protein
VCRDPGTLGIQFHTLIGMLWRLIKDSGALLRE